ncbi:CAP domain-containing protein [Granulicella paludicola]|uniref:CAP domain-containing protein n=1 Tax=Granulicella paludicola TaxID=474951 RepID=UPI0021E0E981|nr:CAP domain-containing protein [Granulicella paludicola]
MKPSWVICLFFALLSLGSTLPVARGQQTSVAEQYLFNALNAERVQRHLKPVRWDAALYRAATYHADEMAERGTISHQFSGEPELSARGARAGAHFSVISENVAMAPNAVEIHDMWMKSPHHRDNILDGTVNRAAIRVVRRDGELFAVEDFDHVVVELSLAEQEERVALLVQDAATIEILPTSEDARRTCEMDSGYAGRRRPWFVMRFTAGELDHLPNALVDKLGSGKYREAIVGACPASGTKNFSAYNVAVLLYP